MKYLLLFFSLIIFSTNAQQKMDILNECRYELKFKEYKKHKPEYRINNFILFFNKKESFFKNMNVYVKDSLISYGKIKLTGDDAIDLATNSKYYTELPMSIYRISNEINFAQKIGDNPYRYFENVEFKWIITKEIKIINGVKCIKATTEKWGRNWMAYYSPKHPVPFGPYKFYGLPGLIFEIYDDKNEYTFKLYRFKNRKADKFILFNYPKAMKITKKQYNIIRHNYAIEPVTDVEVEGVPDIQKKMNAYKLAQEKNYNPIELTE